MQNKCIKKLTLKLINFNILRTYHSQKKVNLNVYINTLDPVYYDVYYELMIKKSNLIFKVILEFLKTCLNIY